MAKGKKKDPAHSNDHIKSNEVRLDMPFEDAIKKAPTTPLPKKEKKDKK